MGKGGVEREKKEKTLELRDIWGVVQKPSRVKLPKIYEGNFNKFSKISLVADENKYRDEQPDITQTERPQL